MRGTCEWQLRKQQLLGQNCGQGCLLHWCDVIPMPILMFVASVSRQLALLLCSTRFHHDFPPLSIHFHWISSTMQRHAQPSTIISNSRITRLWLQSSSPDVSCRMRQMNVSYSAHSTCHTHTPLVCNISRLICFLLLLFLGQRLISFFLSLDRLLSRLQRHSWHAKW